MKHQAVIKKLESSLEHIMQADAAWCAHRLEAARNRLARGKAADELMQKIVDRISVSGERSRARRESLPTPEYDAGLPITKHREEILAALEEHAGQKRASGEPISPEPAWATEVRVMLTRLEGGD